MLERVCTALTEFQEFRPVPVDKHEAAHNETALLEALDSAYAAADNKQVTVLVSLQPSTQ